jgi:FkbM family methyltransferase
MLTTVTLGERSFRVDPRPHHRFWKRVNSGAWEPETYAIFDRHIDDRTLFLDIGAWIGSTSLYGAQLAQRCLAFEPDPVAFAELSRNVAQNRDADWIGKLQIHERAINRDGQSFTLGGVGEGADSTSSALFPDRDSQWTVQALRLPDVLAEHRAEGQPVFLKIDIEGGEYDLIPAVGDILADPLVTAYISFHPRMLRKALALGSTDDSWTAVYADRHRVVLDSLPWSRWIGLPNGDPVTRVQLDQALGQRYGFPEELLIRSP